MQKVQLHGHNMWQKANLMISSDGHFDDSYDYYINAFIYSVRQTLTSASWFNFNMEFVGHRSTKCPGAPYSRQWYAQSNSTLLVVF